MKLGRFKGRVYGFRLPRVLFGTGASEKAGLEARALGGEPALLVTDRNLMEINVPKRVEDALTREGIEVDIFSDVEAEPRIEVAEKVAEAVRRDKYRVIVGVGGGSVLDMAKVASIAATNPGPMRQYIGVGLVRKPGLPKVLIPTTAGTGSEVTDIAVVTLPEDETKTAIVSPHLLGDLAIVDPKLTYTMPPRLTASTGLDALSHALEALMAKNSSPITDHLALKAVELIFRYLPEAYKTGNVGSRYGMSLGSLMAGMAFGNSGVCLGHAVAYTFAVSYGVTHGTSCGLVLPHVFKFNALSIAWKLPKIAEAMGLRTEGLGTEALTQSISEAILKLMDEVEAPKRLRDIGIPKDALPAMADKLLKIKRLLRRNPRPLTREDAYKLISGLW
jgi:alcohol dehydrogenase class IV